jgi:hypothetical protein
MAEKIIFGGFILDLKCIFPNLVRFLHYKKV